MRAPTIGIAIALAALAAAAGCTSTTVTRVPTEEQIDLSGRWNDTDSQQAAQALVDQSVATPWVDDFLLAKGEKPTLIIGTIRNKTPEHIAVKTLVADLERSFINSGRVTVVASSEEREDVRAEREDQQQFASDETVKAWGLERGADYMLIGEVNSQFDAEDGKEVKYYQVDCYLVDLESNVKVWTGFTKIKKFVGRSKYKP
ncbi:MAG TPA: penicillin-binding protein activator LpoB [Thermoanaerobaculales bacterium]|nr:penicillin-binding protein activator LpoB [Thermoanaerobaculales bacterium]HPA81698.1 penicillin-binding protein activator LpoB [Thermoanaerobaculales bacterium]HQL31195.1 penicillin-binding protein activator LpoB [Thermoanaerobaculales bacterium]HQN96297.1 penicillin-binding protein activator LpoB [Thermoanaerobaculales bacterium]HQP43117.1 penicillin-binding protein activator LpoB [Thermoanaerobaculales bacterium]